MWHKLISEDDVRELPPKTRKIFLRFFNVSGGQIIHPRDYQRFNEFIRYCHAKKVKLEEGNLEKLLLRLGQTKEQATKLSYLYAHGRALLKSTCPYVS